MAAINGLRMQVNAGRHRRPGYSISVSDLVDHYIEMELSATAARHSHATRLGYLSILNNWIRPSWGVIDIDAVRTVEIERWLGEQKRLDGSALANSSRAKIRSVFCVLFNHAIRNEWLEQGKNPALYLRQSAKRRRAPDILDPKELQALLTQLESSFRLMVLVAGTTGLRRSELFALRSISISPICASTFNGRSVPESSGTAKRKLPGSPFRLTSESLRTSGFGGRPATTLNLEIGYSRALGLGDGCHSGPMWSCRK